MKQMQHLSPPPPPPPSSSSTSSGGSSAASGSNTSSLVQQFRSMVSFHDLWTNILTFASPSDLQAVDATCSVARSLTRICWSYLLGHKKIQLLTYTKRDDFISEKARVVSSWCKHTRSNKGKFIITGDFQRPSASSIFDIESGTSTRFSDQYGLGTLGSSCQATDVAGNKLLMGGWKNQGEGLCTSMIYALRGDGRSGRRRLGDKEVEAEEQKMSESGSSAGAISLATTASGGGGVGGAKEDLHWVGFASLPLPLSYASATTMVDGRVMVTGGGSSPYQGSDVYADCYVSCVGESPHEYSIKLQERLRLSKEVDEEEQHTVAQSSSSSGGGGGGGGSSSNISSDTDESDWEDLADDIELDYNWKRIAPMKTARCGHVSLTLFDNSLVSIGGYLGGTSYLSSVELMDPGTGEWHSLPNMSCPRTAPGAAVCEHGSIYVFGGKKEKRESGIYGYMDRWIILDHIIYCHSLSFFL
jgi:hypothetical protein